MAGVSVSVNGQVYLVTCDDGEEDHLAELAQFLDQRVSGLVGRFGQVGEARLLLTAGLLLADELAEAQRGVAVLRAELEQLTAARDKLGGEVSEAWQDIVTRASRRLEDIAAGLENP